MPEGLSAYHYISGLLCCAEEYSWSVYTTFSYGRLSGSICDGGELCCLDTHVQRAILCTSEAGSLEHTSILQFEERHFTFCSSCTIFPTPTNAQEQQFPCRISAGRVNYHICVDRGEVSSSYSVGLCFPSN